LQATGSAAHIGTSEYTGIIDPGKLEGVSDASPNLLRYLSPYQGTWRDFTLFYNATMRLPPLSSNPGKIVAVTESNGLLEFIDPPADVAPIRRDVANLENLLTDMHAGNPSTGWSDTTKSAQGGVTQTANEPANVTAAAALTGWKQKRDSTFGEHPVIRIPKNNNIQQYRLKFESDEDGTSYDNLQHYRLLGSGSTWKYYVGPSLAGYESFTLQATGSAAHIGTSRYTGIVPITSLEGTGPSEDSSYVLSRRGTWVLSSVSTSSTTELYNGNWTPRSSPNSQRWVAITFTDSGNTKEWDDFDMINIAIGRRHDPLLVSTIMVSSLEALAVHTTSNQWYDGNSPSAVFIIDQGGLGCAVGVSSNKKQLLFALAQNETPGAQKLIITGIIN